MKLPTDSPTDVEQIVLTSANSASSNLLSLELPAVFLSSGAEETFSLGQSFSSLLKKGSIVALYGGMGAGKTCFVKGVSKGLGIVEEVTSPTYTIISEYEGFLSKADEASVPTGSYEKEMIAVYHIDAYRLKGDDDFLSIGGDEIIFGNGISLIEWSERISASIPATAFKVKIDITEDGKRFISISMGDKI